MCEHLRIKGMFCRHALNQGTSIGAEKNVVCLKFSPLKRREYNPDSLKSTQSLIGETGSRGNDFSDPPPNFRHNLLKTIPTKESS